MFTTVLLCSRPFFYEEDMKLKAVLMDEPVIERTLTRLSYEIVEKTDSLDNLILVGIRTRGIPLAQQIAALVKQHTDRDVATGELDITLYRDDLTTVAELPVVNSTAIDCDITGMDVVLVDDVLYTGRTVRAAIDALFSIGRPKTIRVAVLVDRGHRELPIRADFVGKNIPTSRREVVSVHCIPVDGVCNVELYEKDV